MAKFRIVTQQAAGTSSLTLMLYDASSWASTRVSIQSPAFEHA